MSVVIKCKLKNYIDISDNFNGTKLNMLIVVKSKIKDGLLSILCDTKRLGVHRAEEKNGENIERNENRILKTVTKFLLWLLRGF